MAMHLSDSAVQRSAEPVCLALVNAALSTRLAPEQIRLDDRTQFCVDGIDREARVLCEIFAHMGVLEDGQKKKLAKDILKLLAVEHALAGRWRKVICVIDKPARDFLCGKSWCAGVAREFHFEVVTPPLDESFCLRL